MILFSLAILSYSHSALSFSKVKPIIEKAGSLGERSHPELKYQLLAYPEQGSYDCLMHYQILFLALKHNKLIVSRRDDVGTGFVNNTHLKVCDILYAGYK